MLRFKPFEASSEFSFIDPDNGHKYEARTKAELVQLITNYRAQNRMEPIARLDLVLDHYLCGLPCNLGKCQDTPLERGFLQYLKGGLMLVSKLYYGDKALVSQEEADRRALICKSCPMNSFPDKGAFIQWSDNIAYHSIGDRRSKYHDDLGSCIVCSCTLKALCWYKGALIKDKLEAKSYPSHCWKIEGLKEA